MFSGWSSSWTGLVEGLDRPRMSFANRLRLLRPTCPRTPAGLHPRANVRVANPSARQRFFTLWEPRCGQKGNNLSGWRLEGAVVPQPLSLFVPFLAGSFAVAKLIDGVVGTTLGAVNNCWLYDHSDVGSTPTRCDLTAQGSACSELGISPYSKTPARGSLTIPAGARTTEYVHSRSAPAVNEADPL